MTDFHFYEPGKGHGLPHDPFKAIVGPRPIGWISTQDGDGRVNLAPYSFFGAFKSDPPVIGFCSEGYKDSIANIERTGEFVANLAVRALAEAMNLTSAPFPSDVDEMRAAGLTAAPCIRVAAPRVAESPAALECRLMQIVRLQGLDGRPFDNYLALGQVVGVHIDTHFLSDGLFDTRRADPILRAGYRGDYATIGDMFEMIRPESVPPEIAAIS
jgi:flavin reductase (DIM6/NTAB) family NADH-FMN oxidoreductase RutF